MDVYPSTLSPNLEWNARTKVVRIKVGYEEFVKF